MLPLPMVKNVSPIPLISIGLMSSVVPRSTLSIPNVTMMGLKLR